MALADAARRLAELLAKHKLRVVFAESCTGGLVSASLAQVAGISEHLCGGVVVYRDATKTAYLDIDPSTISQHGAVSERVAHLMAERVLAKTPEADLAASITGHLGPNAPTGLDGVVYIGIADRKAVTNVQRLELSPGASRQERQQLAAEAVLARLSEQLTQLFS